MARQEIDLTTPQPNGKMGEPTKSAWEKVNDMTLELYAGIGPESQNKIINSSFQVNYVAAPNSGTLAANGFWREGWLAGPGGCTYSFSESTRVLTISSGTMIQIVDGVTEGIGDGVHCITWEGNSSATVAGTARAKGSTFSLFNGQIFTISFGAGTVSKVQLVIGSSVNAYLQPSLTSERMRCQPYFWRSALMDSSSATTNTANWYGSIIFPPPLNMRATPLMTTYNSAGVSGFIDLRGSDGSILNGSGVAAFLSADASRGSVGTYSQSRGFFRCSITLDARMRP